MDRQFIPVAYGQGRWLFQFIQKDIQDKFPEFQFQDIIGGFRHQFAA